MQANGSEVKLQVSEIGNGNSFLASRLKKGGNLDEFMLGGIQEVTNDDKLTPDLEGFDNQRYGRSNSIESPMFDFNFQSTHNFKKSPFTNPQDKSPDNSKSSMPSFGSFKKITVNQGIHTSQNRALLSVIKESVCEDNLTFQKEQGEFGRIGSQDGKGLDSDALNSSFCPLPITKFRASSNITIGTGDNQYPFSTKFLEEVKLGSSRPLEPVLEKKSPQLSEQNSENIALLQNRERIASIDCPKPTFIETPLLRDRRSYDMGEFMDLGGPMIYWRGQKPITMDSKELGNQNSPRWMRSIEPKRINTYIMEDNIGIQRTSSKLNSQNIANICGLTEGQLNTSMLIGGSKEAVFKALQDLYSQKQKVGAVLESINARIEGLRVNMGLSTDGTSLHEPSSPLISKRAKSRMASIDGTLEAEKAYLKKNSLKMETSLEHEVVNPSNFVAVSPWCKDSFVHRGSPARTQKDENDSMSDISRNRRAESRCRVEKRSVDTQTGVQVATKGTQTEVLADKKYLQLNKSLADLDCIEDTQVQNKPEARTWHVRTPKNYRVSNSRNPDSMNAGRRTLTDFSVKRFTSDRNGGPNSLNRTRYQSEEQNTKSRPIWKFLQQNSVDLSRRQTDQIVKISPRRELIDPYIKDESNSTRSRQRLESIKRAGLGKKGVGSVYRETVWSEWSQKKGLVEPVGSSKRRETELVGRQQANSRGLLRQGTACKGKQVSRTGN
jgi:hypothetical protein